MYCSLPLSAVFLHVVVVIAEAAAVPVVSCKTPEAAAVTKRYNSVSYGVLSDSPGTSYSMCVYM